jgi:hypothetical protein
MKMFSNYLAMLVVLLATSSAVFAQSRATPLERAQQIAQLTAGGPYDPAPAVPASDIVDHQRELRPR